MDLCPIDGLAYVAVSSARLDEWREYGQQVLGLAVSSLPVENGFALRADERLARLIIADDGGAEGIAAVGWEVHGRQEWSRLLETLRAEGYDPEIVDGAEARRRAVAAYARITDPSGYVLEFALAPVVEPIAEFVSPVGARFVMGDQGMGHVTQLVSHYDESVDFYTRVLGFHVRETIDLAIRATFASCNPRQHSVALIDGNGASAEHHIMFEVDDLDTVGRALDKALAGQAQLTVGLGKHWNDKMTSFYMRTPSGFEVEYGFGGLRVDPAAWTETTQGGVGGASLWGHHPVRDLADSAGMAGFNQADGTIRSQH